MSRAMVPRTAIKSVVMEERMDQHAKISCLKGTTLERDGQAKYNTANNDEEKPQDYVNEAIIAVISGLPLPERDKAFPFMKLPPETRDEIYRLLFVRRAGILPARNYKLKRRPLTDPSKPYNRRRGIKYHEDRYQWAESRQFKPYEPAKFPSSRGDCVDLSWPSAPTGAQSQLIVKDDQQLPVTYTPDGDRVKHWRRTRRDGIVEVVNWRECFVRAIYGVELLRTCKQIYLEATEILYSENHFHFDTKWFQFQYQPCLTLAKKGFTRPSSNSCELADGPKATQRSPKPQREQILNAIHLIVSKEKTDGTFSSTDALVKFLVQIGRRSTSLLRSLEFEGTFKTSRNDYKPSLGPQASFALALDLYSIILDRHCLNLRKVTISIPWLFGVPQDKGKNWGPPLRGLLWEDGLHKQRDISDEQRISDVVGNFVRGVPRVEELQLIDVKHTGSYVLTLPQSENWGKAYQWVDFVKQRHVKSLLETAGTKKEVGFIKPFEIIQGKKNGEKSPEKTQSKKRCRVHKVRSYYTAEHGRELARQSHAFWAADKKTQLR